MFYSYPWNQFRLNPDVIPMRYDITFQPNITNEQSNFSGHVTIEVQVRQPIDAFIVHADAELNITKSLLSTNDNQSIEIESEFRNLPFQFYILKLRNKVKPNVFKLYFEFHGNMADRTWSLYKGSYQIGNKTIGVAATQFEMHNARIAFPCFDEPGFKSIYKVNIVHEPQHNVYSNMNPVKRYSNSNGLITTEFNQTLKISSYLLAIVVGEFVCVNNSIDDIIVSACSSPIQQHKLNYSLDLATKLMGYYTDYFQISYPLSKIEHIAIPVDFAAGAMENWGLILYQEKLFLYDDEDTTTTDKMEVNSVIAHELSHQVSGQVI